jgi:predicted alpha/beta-fold hydrolase
VIQQLEKRLAKKSSNNSYLGGPIYLVGYSLGANIVTKYLGEESLHGTLPKCIGGGAALGNPLHIASNTVPFPWNMILAMGVKRSLLQNFSVYNQHHERGFRNAIKKAMTSRTIGQLDDACAPYILRNEPYPPFAPRVGYQDGNEYWHDSSSHRYVGHVSVPLLKVAAKDDFLVFGQFARKLNHCLENPNVVVVKTRCGGHLGWQESPPPRKDANGNDVASSWFGGGIGSWSDVAVADFIEALLQIKHEDECREKEGSVREGALTSIVSKL